MTNGSDLLDLVERLDRATTDGKVKWHETVDPDSFRTNLGDGSVRVTKLVDYNDDESFTSRFQIVILNKEGKIVHEGRPENSVQEEIFSGLHSKARYRALQAEKVIESIWKALG